MGLKTLVVALLFVALGLVVAGAAWWYPPAGLMVAGAGLAVLVLFVDWGSDARG